MEYSKYLQVAASRVSTMNTTVHQNDIDKDNRDIKLKPIRTIRAKTIKKQVNDNFLM